MSQERRRLASFLLSKWMQPEHCIDAYRLCQCVQPNGKRCGDDSNIYINLNESITPPCPALFNNVCFCFCIFPHLQATTSSLQRDESDQLEYTSASAPLVQMAVAKVTPKRPRFASMNLPSRRKRCTVKYRYKLYTSSSPPFAHSKPDAAQIVCSRCVFLLLLELLVIPSSLSVTSRSWWYAVNRAVPAAVKASPTWAQARNVLSLAR